MSSRTITKDPESPSLYRSVSLPPSLCSPIITLLRPPPSPPSALMDAGHRLSVGVHRGNPRKQHWRQQWRANHCLSQPPSHDGEAGELFCAETSLLSFILRFMYARYNTHIAPSAGWMIRAIPRFMAPLNYGKLIVAESCVGDFVKPSISMCGFI